MSTYTAPQYWVKFRVIDEDAGIDVDDTFTTQNPYSYYREAIKGSSRVSIETPSPTVTKYHVFRGEKLSAILTVRQLS